MKNIIIIEDSSVNDLGGGQRITLEAINVLRKNNFKLKVFDIGGGCGFSQLVKDKGIFFKSFRVKNKIHFFLKIPFIVLEILKDSREKELIYYPTTKKSLVVAFFIKIINPRIKIVFHQHARSGFFVDQLKKIAQKVILPGRYRDDLGDEYLIIQNPIVIRKSKKKYSGRYGDELVLGFLGGVTELKGFKVFLEIINEKKYKFKIAGSGELVGQIPKDINVEYLGYLNEESKIDFLNDIDVLVFPSIVPEPFPLVCFESLFNYNPVVCFDLGFPSQLIRDFNVGVVAKSMDKQSLSVAIEECVKKIEILSGNCYNVIKKYDNNNFEIELIKIFNEL